MCQLVLHQLLSQLHVANVTGRGHNIGPTLSRQSYIIRNRYSSECNKQLRILA